MERVLRLMADKGASDVYLTANSPIQLKINGQLMPVSDQILTPGQPRALEPRCGARPVEGSLQAENHLNKGLFEGFGEIPGSSCKRSRFPRSRS